MHSPPGTRPTWQHAPSGGSRDCCAPRPASSCAATPTSTRRCSAPGCCSSGNADRINDPKCLPGWLSTTARREALAILRGQQRAIPSEDVAEHVAPDETDVATALMDDELRRALDQAVEKLPPSQRLIVQALLREPESYDALSAELGIPRGSLGPLRGRAVRALRAQLEPSLR